MLIHTFEPVCSPTHTFENFFSSLPAYLQTEFEFRPLNTLDDVTSDNSEFILVPWDNSADLQKALQHFKALGLNHKNLQSRKLIIDHSGENGVFPIIDDLIHELNLDPLRIFYLCQGAIQQKQNNQNLKLRYQRTLSNLTIGRSGSV